MYLSLPQSALSFIMQIENEDNRKNVPPVLDMVSYSIAILQLFYSYSIVEDRWILVLQVEVAQFKAIGHFSKKVQVSSTNINLAGINVLCFIMLWAVFKSQSSFKISSFYLEAKGGTNLVLVHKLYCIVACIYTVFFFLNLFLI